MSAALRATCSSSLGCKPEKRGIAATSSIVSMARNESGSMLAQNARWRLVAGSAARTGHLIIDWVLTQWADKKLLLSFRNCMTMPRGFEPDVPSLQGGDGADVFPT